MYLRMSQGQWHSNRQSQLRELPEGLPCICHRHPSIHCSSHHRSHWYRYWYRIWFWFKPIWCCPNIGNCHRHRLRNWLSTSQHIFERGRQPPSWGFHGWSCWYLRRNLCLVDKAAGGEANNGIRIRAGGWQNKALKMGCGTKSKCSNVRFDACIIIPWTKTRLFDFCFGLTAFLFFRIKR